MTKSALIIGGGIAGMACGVRLAERGVRVTLLETRKKLGGRATSFQDVRSGRWLDNCQHVVLGCCTNYLDLLERLGVRDKIVWHREQYWMEQGGRVSVVARGSLPAPGHFTGSFLRASFLSLGEKLQIARACARIMRVDRRDWEDRTFAEFLARCAQSERVVRRFWSPVVVSACNLEVGKVAASSALHVFQEGFLAAREAADIGVPGVPLLELYERAEVIISGGGGDGERGGSGGEGGRVLLGTGVERVDEFGAVTNDGQRFDADVVVCAVPVERVNRIVDPALRERDARFASLDRFTHSPILGVHLTFDRPMLPDHPHAVLVDRPTQWLFRKDAQGKSLHAVISGADEWIALSEEEIGRRVLADILACVPAGQTANPPALVGVRAVKEKLATFAPVPGLTRFRPDVRGNSRLVLAGDYTATGWPATMEGATRSGYAAAEAAIDLLGLRENGGAGMVLPPLPIAPLARLAGLRAS